MNYRQRIVVCLMICTFVIHSCDCVQRQEGIVIDLRTKESIAGVEIFKESRPSQKYYSNSCGYFEWDGISGGLLPVCPTPKLYFIHSDYDTLILKDSQYPQIIRMNKR